MSSCSACGNDISELVRPVNGTQIVACNACLNISQVVRQGDTITVTAMDVFPQLKTMTPDGSVMSQVMKAMPKGVSNLPVLAEAPQKVAQASLNPDTAPGDVVELIEQDVALTTKILSMANSAYYATVTEIADLPTACSRLGMKTISNIANTMACANQYKSKDPVARKFMQSLWEHAIVTAHCAEALGTKFAMDSKLAFIAGLLHDVGKVVMIDIITTKFADGAGKLVENPQVLCKAIDPFAPIVGLHVIQHWKLSLGLTFSTAFVLHPNATPHDEFIDLAHLVRLASDIADMKGYGIMGQGTSSFAGHPSIEHIGTTPEELTALADSYQEMLDSILGVMGNVAAA